MLIKQISNIISESINLVLSITLLNFVFICRKISNNTFDVQRHSVCNIETTTFLIIIVIHR